MAKSKPQVEKMLLITLPSGLVKSVNLVTLEAVIFAELTHLLTMSLEVFQTFLGTMKPIWINAKKYVMSIFAR